MTRIYRSTIPEAKITQKDPSRILPVALAVPLLAAAIGCTRANNIADLAIPPEPVISVTTRVFDDRISYKNPKLTQVNDLCVSDCTSDSDMFNSGSAATVVDFSKGGLYHKLAYNYSGSELLWEGFGNDSIRVYLKQDGNDFFLKVARKFNGGWVADDLHKGTEAKKMWFVYLNHILNGGPDYCYYDRVQVGDLSVRVTENGQVVVYQR